MQHEKLNIPEDVEVDRVELWKEGHKQKEGKENPGVVEALVRTL